MSEFEILTLQQANRDFWLSVVIAIISFLSAYFVYKDYKNRKNKERAEKSIQIAEEFAKNIIVPLSYINSIFKKLEIDKLINKVSFLDFSDFDCEELKELFSVQDVVNYQELLNKNESYTKDKAIIINTLNRLEYLCMYVATEIADEKYIYNSLHQQFLSAIALLYFEISLINTDNKDKYYTNIIQVYNLWKNKYIESIKNEQKIKKKQKKLKTKLLPSSPKI